MVARCFSFGFILYTVYIYTYIYICDLMVIQWEYCGKLWKNLLLYIWDI